MKNDVEILKPQFTLTGICRGEFCSRIFACDGCTNSAPWNGFPAGSLYVSEWECGGHDGDVGPFAIGFRRLPDPGDDDDHEPIDFATLPAGEWSVVLVG